MFSGELRMMRKLCVMLIVSLVFVGRASHAVSPTQIFDSFGDLCCDAEKAHLDNFAIALERQPLSKGYIIFYGGRRQHYPYCHSPAPWLQRRGEPEARAARLKPYLVYSRGLNPRQVVVINGGYRESWTAELWIVPNGAGPPNASPTVQPGEIRFRKGIIKKRAYECEV
jgi:hypothetical protein